MAAVHKIDGRQVAGPQVIAWVEQNLTTSQLLLDQNPHPQHHHKFYKRQEARCTGPICNLMKAELRIRQKDRYFGDYESHDQLIDDQCKGWSDIGIADHSLRLDAERLCQGASERAQKLRLRNP